ncbi:MAG: hypothetical protein NDJ90_13070 [Oligoflexia bacterium]|nr:hypothetical protein [Oligoflexia bacterium]
MKTLQILTISFTFWLTGCAHSGLAGKTADTAEFDPVAAAALRFRTPASSPATLSPEERQAELMAEQRVLSARENRQLILGMTMDDVREVWGLPQEVQAAGEAGAGYERWTYFEGLSSRWSVSPFRVVYFEKGQVAGWETQDPSGARDN